MLENKRAVSQLSLIVRESLLGKRDLSHIPEHMGAHSLYEL